MVNPAELLLTPDVTAGRPTRPPIVHTSAGLRHYRRSGNESADLSTYLRVAETASVSIDLPARYGGSTASGPVTFSETRTALPLADWLPDIIPPRPRITSSSGGHRRGARQLVRR